MTTWRVEFASCYVYSPSGDGPVCARSRLLRSLVKAGDARFMVRYALRVQQQVSETAQLADFFQGGDLLVPVPGSTPSNEHKSWVAERLTDALLQEGLGSAAWHGLKRIRAVRKSATSAPRCRPTVAVHFDSFAMNCAAIRPERIVLIDDVITKGRTLLAAAARVREAYPAVQIRAFALLRTMGTTNGVRRLLEPCRGEISWVDGDARRRP